MNYIDSLWVNRPIPEESYLNNIPSLKNLKEGEPIKLNKSVSFFVGENGTGKSTLLEAIAVLFGFNVEGGSKNFNFSTVGSKDTELSKFLTLSKKAYPKDGFFLRGESFFNVATEVEKLRVSGYGEKSLHAQSHGESFFSLFENRFRGNGLYLLDEPEAALSPNRLLALLCYMHNLINAKSQFIIATHSPILLAYPGAEIFQLSGGGMKKVKYKETEIYRSYRDFLEDPEGIMEKLFKEER